MVRVLLYHSIIITIRVSWFMLLLLHYEKQKSSSTISFGTKIKAEVEFTIGECTFGPDNINYCWMLKSITEFNIFIFTEKKMKKTDLYSFPLLQFSPHVLKTILKKSEVERSVYCWSIHFSYVCPTKESSTWAMLSYFLLPEWPDNSEKMSLYSSFIYLFGTLEGENWKLKCNYHFSYSMLPRCISLICVANLVAEIGKMSCKFAIFVFHDVQLINNIISYLYWDVELSRNSINTSPMQVF